MLWSTLTFLFLMALYPLSLIEITPLTPGELSMRLLVSFQLISASFGSFLSLCYTLYLWYAALTGTYEVDTYSSSHRFRSHQRRRIDRASKLTLKEQILILFGTTDILEILDTWQFDSRPLPLKGLEWTFLHSEGGITTSDEEEEESLLADQF